MSDHGVVMKRGCWSYSLAGLPYVHLWQDTLTTVRLPFNYVAVSITITVSHGFGNK